MALTAAGGKTFPHNGKEGVSALRRVMGGQPPPPSTGGRDRGGDFCPCWVVIEVFIIIKQIVFF